MIDSEKKIWLHELCLKNGLSITAEQIDMLDFYRVLLLEWNKKINIISRKDEENVWSFHILHSISILFKIEIKQNASIVDIGTGGGLPGIPIKILRPDIFLFCIDSTGKKIKAVSQIINDLKLNNVTTAWGRAEDLGSHPENFGKYDFAVARAVAPLKDLIYWSKAFLKTTALNSKITGDKLNGRLDPVPPALLAFKGGDISKEIESAKRKYKNVNIESIDLNFAGSQKFLESDKKILIVHL